MYGVAPCYSIFDCVGQICVLNMCYQIKLFLQLFFLYTLTVRKIRFKNIICKKLKHLRR